MARTAVHNRDESLDKALQVFWQQGFVATSLKDLERSLDLRPGSIYASFGSKEELFREALERYAERSMAELERIFAAYESPLDGVVAYLRSLGALRERDVPCRACMMVKTLLEFGDRDDQVGRQAEQLLARMERRFGERLAEAVAAGEIRADIDPDRLARRLQVDVVGLRTYAQRSVDARAVREVAEDIAADWEGLKAG